MRVQKFKEFKEFSSVLSVKSVVKEGKSREDRLLASLWIYCVKHPLADIRYKIRYKDEGLTVG